MELAHIKYFLAICEARHFTRAAIACGISQPSLSVAIGRLEKELGEPLFDRGRGPPVRLTRWARQSSLTSGRFGETSSIYSDLSKSVLPNARGADRRLASSASNK
jgi:Bacterial regulatory helix-turn-helix protein, lysR family